MEIFGSPLSVWSRSGMRVEAALVAGYLENFLGYRFYALFYHFSSLFWTVYLYIVNNS